MATQPAYYSVLQVCPRAENEVIDAAYRRLASKYHSDVSQVSDATDRMKQINIACEVVSDPAKRAAHDASRATAPSPCTSPDSATQPRYSSKTWRTLLIAAVVILLAVAVFRLGPVFLSLVPKLIVPLAVISVVVWLLFTTVAEARC